MQMLINDVWNFFQSYVTPLGTLKYPCCLPYGDFIQMLPYESRCQFHQRFLFVFFVQIFDAKPNVTRENDVRTKNLCVKH